MATQSVYVGTHAAYTGTFSCHGDPIETYYGDIYYGDPLQLECAMLHRVAGWEWEDIEYDDFSEALESLLAEPLMGRWF